jgi:hypothetical protein
VTLIFCPGLRLLTPKPAEFPEGFGFTFVGAFDVTLNGLNVGFGVGLAVDFDFVVGFALGRELPSTTVTLIFWPGLMLFTVTELFAEPFVVFGGAISSGFFTGEGLADGVVLGVEVGVAEGFGVAFGEVVGFGVEVGLGLADGEGFGVLDGVGDGVGFAEGDDDGEGEAEGVALGVGVGDGVTTGVGTDGPTGADGAEGGVGAETGVKVMVSALDVLLA